MGTLTAEDVARYYRWLLDREPEPIALADYRALGITRAGLVRMIVTSDEFAQRLERAGLPTLLPSPTEPVPDVRQSAFWHRYVPSANADSPVPFREIGNQTYRVPIGSNAVITKTSSSNFELALLYALARDYWSGEGEIVDLGCSHGLTTRCLAEGIRQNSSVRDEAKGQRIYAYDLFLAENDGAVSNTSSMVHSGSSFCEFLALNSGCLDAIVPCPGNLLHMTWGMRPIEILMIDASKSWTLNAWIVRHMFPRLVPNRSIVIQKDQIHYLDYWVLMTMEYFRDHFDHIDTISVSSAYALCIAPISEEQACVDLEALPFVEKERLLLAAISRCQPSVQLALQVAHAKLLIDNDLSARAHDVLMPMTITCPSDDPASDLCKLARSERTSLLAGLDTTRT